MVASMRTSDSTRSNRATDQRWQAVSAQLRALRAKWRPSPLTLLVCCGLVLVSAIATGTGLMILHYRDRAMSSNERELKSTALILAEHSDRAFQALELVQKNVIERMQALGIASREDFERRMSGHDVHLMLKDAMETAYPQQQSLGNLSRRPLFISNAHKTRDSRRAAGASD
jgi:hypothetical protein